MEQDEKGWIRRYPLTRRPMRRLLLFGVGGWDEGVLFCLRACLFFCLFVLFCFCFVFVVVVVFFLTL